MTETSEDTAPSWASSNTAWLIGTALAVVMAYNLWLGWHVKQHAAWQVAGLAVTWALIVFGSVWGSRRWAGMWGAVLAIVVVWSIDNSGMSSEDANLWPVGAILLAPGAAAAGVVLALVTMRVARSRRTRTPYEYDL